MTTDNHRPLHGKYRGKVLDNADPLELGRLLVSAPAITGGLMNWAMPCFPYAGPDRAQYPIPPIGTNIWVEFEAGDVNYPVWTGCFWDSSDAAIGDSAP